MAELLKNSINLRAVSELANRIKRSYDEFEKDLFTRTIMEKLDKLELTERINLIANTLENYLPGNFEKAAQILVASLGDELDDQADDPVAKDYSSNNGFIVLASTTFIANNGLEHYETSMKALYEMTKRFSSEGAIRDFIISDEEKTLKLYQNWVADRNVHVRRLVSESLRPKLPWTRQLVKYVKDPQPVLPFLEKLKNDKHLYVRRSVANNLNDISKDNPEIVVAVLEKWNEDNSPNMKWLIKHALRTLVKKGHPKALKLLGISSNYSVTVDNFSLSKKKLNFGESQEILLELSTDKKNNQTLLIDYLIYHMKANGKLIPKVFKWTKIVINNKQPIFLTKRHPLKEISTRKYYPGRHEVHVQINGKIIASEDFILIK